VGDPEPGPGEAAGDEVVGELARRRRLPTYPGHAGGAERAQELAPLRRTLADQQLTGVGVGGGELREGGEGERVGLHGDRTVPAETRARTDHRRVDRGAHRRVT